MRNCTRDEGGPFGVCFGSITSYRAYVEHFRYPSNRYRIAALQRTAEFPSRQTSGYVVTVRFENMEGTS
jgi:hypothetical protein